SLPLIFFIFTSLLVRTYLPSGEIFLSITKLSGLLMTTAVPPFIGIMYDLRTPLFASQSGVLTEYTTFLPSFDMPTALTLPSFHKSSGVILFCAMQINGARNNNASMILLYIPIDLCAAIYQLFMLVRPF